MLFFKLVTTQLSLMIIKKKIELAELKSNYVSNEIIEYENIELKELINDYASSSNKLLAKIIVDHDSPFLKVL